MKVSDNSSASTAEFARKMDEKIRNQNAAKEAELENVKSLYDKKIEAAKSFGEEQYVNSLKRNEDMLIGASHEYEEKLNGYKENLERTQKSVAFEEMAIKNDHESKIQNSREQFMSNIQEQYKHAGEMQEDIHAQTQSNVQLMSDKSRAEKNHLETATRTKLNALSNDFNQKGINDEKNYRAQLEANIKAHDEEVRIQQKELKDVVARDLKDNKLIEEEKSNVHKAELSYLDNHQKEMMAQKQNDFKIRYEKLVKEHDAVLADLKIHLEKDVKSIVNQNSEQKKLITSKIDDKFYRIESLTPSVVDLEKEMIVSIKVPEHEKENVNLSAHGRDIKMTFTRRFTDSMEAEDGSTNKSTRNELYSKDFNSKDILNSKSITQKYENGTLQYKIQKL